MVRDTGQGMERRADDGVAVVVLHEQGPRIPAEHVAELAGARRGDHGTRGVLGPVGHDQGPCPAVQRPFHGFGARAVVVDGDRNRPQSECRDQVQQTRPGGVLHGHRVPGPQMGVEHALDGVERPGGDGDRAVRHAVRVQCGPGQPRQLGVDGGLPVKHRPRVVVACRRREGVVERG